MEASRVADVSSVSRESRGASRRPCAPRWTPVRRVSAACIAACPCFGIDGYSGIIRFSREHPAMTKYVFVTGGVVSSLRQGIAAASLAAILESRGLKVTLLKLDPYINVDPGTMSPFQHGEVFVTEDGAETDLDLGH